MLQKAKREGNLRGVNVYRGSPSITHLLFVDDSIIFGEATYRGRDVVKDILSCYEKALGQQVNFDKSVIFFSSNVEDAVAYQVVHRLEVRRLNSVERYLALPSLVRRNKRVGFTHLNDRMC